MSDRDVNRTAFCSAVFAGFAYVGYTLFKQQIDRQSGKRDCQAERPPELLRKDTALRPGCSTDRGFSLRRLSSQTTQTHRVSDNSCAVVAPLTAGGGGGDTGGSRLVFTSSSVQQRIKQLNQQARQFAETMLVVQGRGTRRPHGAHHRSSQCTPWSTPRTLSPVNYRVLASSQSTDHLSALANPASAIASVASPSPYAAAAAGRFFTAPRRRRRRLTGDDVTGDDVTDDAAAAAVCDVTEQDRQLLLELLQADNKRLNGQQADVLVKMLRTGRVDLVQKTLVTIADYCAFTVNQEILREAGVVPLLTASLLHPCSAVQMAASRAASNMALNDTNQTFMQDCVEVLLSLLDTDDIDVKEAVLSCLVNISVLDRWHQLFTPYLSLLYSIADEPCSRLQLQTLRLLVNLSCNDSMVPSLLAARGPEYLLRLLSADCTDECVLLRCVTAAANLASAAGRLHIDPAHDLPLQHKAAAPDTMYAQLLGANSWRRVRDKCDQLLMSDSADARVGISADVRAQAHRLKQAVLTVCDRPSSGSRQ